MVDTTKAYLVLIAWRLFGVVVATFEGGKTLIFWLGLILLGLAVFELFGVIWYVFVLDWGSWWSGGGWLFAGPWIFGGVVFLLIGLYMMVSGVKKE